MLEESEYRLQQLDEYEDGVSKLQTWIDDTKQHEIARTHNTGSCGQTPAIEVSINNSRLLLYLIVSFWKFGELFTPCEGLGFRIPSLLDWSVKWIMVF